MTDIVTNTGETIRLDKFLSENFSVSRTRAETLIEKGFCTVNDVVVLKKNHAVNGEDNVALDVPPPAETEILPENIPLDIRYEDNNLLVVNKPQGMVVHPSAGHYSGTLVNALMYYCGKDLSGINGELRPGILHRIDMNTSGLLLTVKNDFAHNFLSEQIKAHSMGRYYEAVCDGVIRESGTVNAPIGRSNADRKKMCVNPRGAMREAVTHYEVLQNFKAYTHVRLKLETGRTHQIRVHMAHIGHPVSGDNVYGKKINRLAGQCLHARKLGFVRPSDNMYIETESELPDYFVRFLNFVK